MFDYSGETLTRLPCLEEAVRKRMGVHQDADSQTRRVYGDASTLIYQTVVREGKKGRVSYRLFHAPGVSVEVKEAKVV
jgi:hypothetical protein